MSTTAVVPKIIAVYIVTAIRDKEVVLTDFFKYVKDEKEGGNPQLVFSNILTQNLVGSDGKEVDLSLGALVHIESIRIKSAIGFHIANVGPSDERGMLQYQYALEKLGLSKQKLADATSFLVEMGKFDTKHD